jgi:hypothetical protein
VKPIVTGSLEAGPDQLVFESVTCSGSGRVNAPLARWPGSETLSAASPAELITFAVVDAVYVWSTPGVNAPNVAGAPSVSASVAGVVPETVPGVLVAPAGTVTETGSDATDGLPV